MHSTIDQVLSRANNIDLPNLIVKKIMPKITTQIEQFRQSEMALRGAALERRLTQPEELDILLARKYASMGSGKLHPAVENLSSTFTWQTEEAHLKKLVHRILPLVLSEKEAKSKTVKVAVRDMEGDFEDFQRSPLWFRVVGDTESNNAMTASVIGSSVVSGDGPSPFNTIRKRLQDKVVNYSFINLCRVGGQIF